MNANTLLATIAILLALGFWLLGRLKFLVPYRHILFHQYGSVLLLWLAILFINVFATLYAMQRKFFLKDTGRKLSHLDKQLHVGHGELPAPSFEEEDDHRVA